MNMANYHITAFSLTDIPDIMGISAQCFGQHYYNEQKLSNYLNKTGIHLVIKSEGQILGFCLSSLCSANELSQLYGIESYPITKVAIIQTIAIHPKYQRQGYATKLLYYIINQINTKFKGVNVFYPCWNEPTSLAFCNSLKGYAFSAIKKIDDYWYHDSIVNKYRCAKCGNPPCRCSLQLFQISLKS